MNPLAYFQEHPANEGLVLQVDFKTPKTLVIVVERPLRLYACASEHPARGVREFVRFEFGGLKHYSRTQSSRPLESHTDYNLHRDKGGVAIYGVKVTTIANGYSFEATLSNFGIVSFEFSSFTIERCSAKAVGQTESGDWKYVNQATGEVVDFYNPFASQCQ